MTLIVGERYKARNGKAVRIVEDIGGGMFAGYTGDRLNARVVYHANGSTLADGWRDWSIDGLAPPKPLPAKIVDIRVRIPGDMKVSSVKATVPHLGDGIEHNCIIDGIEETAGGIKQEQPDGSIRYWFNVEDVKELAERRLQSLEREARRTTDDRLDKLEAMCSDLFRQLRGVRDKIGQKRDLIADGAAKTGELVERLDETDRRMVYISERVGNIQDRVSQAEKDIATVGDRGSQLEERLNAEVNDITDRIDELNTARAWIDTKTVRERMEKFESRLTGVGGIFEANKRIAALEQTLARIEDMLTAEKPKIDHHDGTVKGCECYICQRLRAEVKPKRFLKGGWINVYPGRYLSGIFNSEVDAKLSDDAQPIKRVACIQIPDFTEGEGL